MLHLKGKGRKYKDPPPVYKYEWRLDDDIVDSQRHTENVEEQLDKQMDYKSFWDRGYNILNSGDKAIKSVYL